MYNFTYYTNPISNVCDMIHYLGEQCS